MVVFMTDQKKEFNWNKLNSVIYILFQAATSLYAIMAIINQLRDDAPDLDDDKPSE